MSAVTPSPVAARAVTRVLVANRGEVAARVFRTCRSLGLGTVAVYADPDADLPYVREADLAVPLAGSSAAETYLDTGKLLAAAARAGADAIHPGYGFLAESPDFARAVIAAGLTWIGPRPETIALMGSKIEAKRVAAEAGVPLAPSAEVTGDDEIAWAEAATSVGFPLLVKASAGGGGRGMRLVEEPSGLVDAIRSARREAASAFGDGTVFLERFLRGARHVEVQILGDEHGRVVHLYERECSIQRRHQKIVEEAPSPGTDPATLRAMWAAAVALGRLVGYVGLGTVEFLVSGERGQQEFFFLEMNTRLQVEHPVTERLTMTDLVRLQLQVAQGLPHGLDDGGFDVWPDDAPDEFDPAGLEPVETEHPEGAYAIEARLYAEDPAAGYLPSTGPVLLFEPGGDEGVRWDVGVETGSVVSPHFDALLAKAVAEGRTRTEAVARLTRALRSTRIHGVRTNRDQLVAILESGPFLAGVTPTDFLELFPELVAPEVPAEVSDAHLVAAVLHGVHVRQAASPLRFAPAGWRNVPSGPDHATYARPDGRTVEVRYTLRAGDTATVGIDGVDHEVSLPRPGLSGPHGADHGVVDAVVDGVRRRLLVELYPDHDGLVHVDGAGWSTSWRELPRFAEPDDVAAAGAPSTPVPGTVTAVEVAVGDHVTEGQTLVVLEAMKMEHRVSAGSAGTVAAVLVGVGQSVDAHEVLVVLEPEVGDG